MDLSATLINSWPPDCNVFLFFSRVLIWSFAAWSAKSQLLIGIFLGIKIPTSRPMFEGPSAHNPDLKQAISPTPALGAWATSQLSVPTLPSRAHPQDYGRRHNSLKLVDWLAFGQPFRILQWPGMLQAATSRMQSRSGEVERWGRIHDRSQASSIIGGLL